MRAKVASKDHLPPYGLRVLVQIFNLSIVLRNKKEHEGFHDIPIMNDQKPSSIGVHLRQHGNGDTAHLRLHWSVNDPPVPTCGAEAESYPVSKMTGQISHFVVLIRRVSVRVYGLEMVLPSEYEAEWHDKGRLVVRIDCVRFGGECWEGDEIVLEKDDTEWEIVHRY